MRLTSGQVRNVTPLRTYWASVLMCVLVKLCPTLWDPMECSYGGIFKRKRKVTNFWKLNEKIIILVVVL